MTPPLYKGNHEGVLHLFKFGNGEVTSASWFFRDVYIFFNRSHASADSTDGAVRPALDLLPLGNHKVKGDDLQCIEPDCFC